METSTPCFECGQPAHHEHHVVPRSRGGKMTVPLCLDCHAKVHGLRAMAHPELTRAALAALKARGVTLGTPANLTDEARAKGASRNKALSQTAYKLLEPIMVQLRADGLTYQAIADRLNGHGYKTRRGKDWVPAQVKRVLDRLEK